MSSRSAGLGVARIDLSPTRSSVPGTRTGAGPPIRIIRDRPRMSSRSRCCPVSVRIPFKKKKCNLSETLRAMTNGRIVSCGPAVSSRSKFSSTNSRTGMRAPGATQKSKSTGVRGEPYRRTAWPPSTDIERHTRRASAERHPARMCPEGSFSRDRCVRIGPRDGQMTRVFVEDRLRSQVAATFDRGHYSTVFAEADSFHGRRFRPGVRPVQDPRFLLIFVEFFKLVDTARLQLAGADVANDIELAVT
jgi:hypothetical protein